METKKKKFREFETLSGKQILTGKSAETNELLVKQVKNNEIVLHTAKPGSPFVNIKAHERDVTSEDIKEAAVICAKYSQDWRDNKKDVAVHIFGGRDIGKEKRMPLGTFAVKKFKEIKVKKQEILEFEDKLKGSNEKD